MKLINIDLIKKNCDRIAKITEGTDNSDLFKRVIETFESHDAITSVTYEVNYKIPEGDSYFTEHGFVKFHRNGNITNWIGDDANKYDG